MTQQKINHPFHVPDDFFESFAPEILEKTDRNPRPKKVKSLLINIAKYAAIVVFSFFIGRVSVTLLTQRNDSSERKELYTVDAVYSQVSEDDIDNFIIENAPSDLLK